MLRFQKQRQRRQQQQQQPNRQNRDYKEEEEEEHGSRKMKPENENEADDDSHDDDVNVDVDAGADVEEQAMKEEQIPRDSNKNQTKDKKKRGGQLGQKRKNRPASFWYNLCVKYDEQRKQFKSQVEFLRSEASGEDVSAANKMVFSRQYRNYKMGLLVNANIKRDRLGRFPNVAQKLIDYVTVRSTRLFVRDRYGMNITSLRDKATLFARSLGIPQQRFLPNARWVYGTLQNAHKLDSIVLQPYTNNHTTHHHGGDERTTTTGRSLKSLEKERQRKYNTWKQHFHQVIQDTHVENTSCIYSADHTSLSFAALPSRLYITKNYHQGTNNNETHERHIHDATRQMSQILKDKITLMMCTSADGTRVPLTVIGTHPNPNSFTLCTNGQPPLIYKHSPEGGLLTPDITTWWIHTVFWPWHVHHRGNDARAILLLDSCPSYHGLHNHNDGNKNGHDDDNEKKKLPDKLTIVYFPKNAMNSWHDQPIGRGIITSLKIKYRIHMIAKLLSVFQPPHGYEQTKMMLATKRNRKRHNEIFMGMNYGEKATILDAMEILNHAWSHKQDEEDFQSNDNNGQNNSTGSSRNRYCVGKKEIIQYWKKTNILPFEMEIDIFAQAVADSSSLTSDGHYNNRHDDEKSLRITYRDELCALLERLSLYMDQQMDENTNKYDDDDDAIPPVLQHSFFTDVEPLTRMELEEAVQNWIMIEDDQMIIESEIDDALATMGGEDDEEKEENDIVVDGGYSVVELDRPRSGDDDENDDNDHHDDEEEEDNVKDEQDEEHEEGDGLSNIQSFFGAHSQLNKIRKFCKQQGMSSDTILLCDRLDYQLRTFDIQNRMESNLSV